MMWAADVAKPESRELRACGLAALAESGVLVLPVWLILTETRGLHIGVMALMSGSGATVFGVFDNSEVLERSLAEMRAKGYWAESVRTINRLDYRDTIFE